MIYSLFSVGKLFETGVMGILLNLDCLIFGLVSSAFKVFMAIASARLLSSEAYTMIANKVYLIIGVLMLFILSYSILKAIVNPDEANKAFGPGIIKRVVIAVVGLAIAPALFNLMYQAQALVLEHNVLGKIFFRSDNTPNVQVANPNGGSGGQSVNPDDYINAVGGSVTATTIWQAFFYPAPDSGMTAEDIKGNLSDYYLNKAAWNGVGCAIGAAMAYGGFAAAGGTFGVSMVVGILGLAVSAFTCTNAVGNLGQAAVTNEEITLAEAYVMSAQGESFGIYTIFISNYVDDGEIHYLYIISTIAGAFCLYAFVSFSIDMGIRAAKLAYYQIIAPIPLILQVLPGKGDSTFKTYTKDVINTFLEVFIRIAVVYIVVYIICHLQDLFSSADGIWGNQNLSSPEIALAMALLILGLITFCKDAPKFLSKSLGIDGGNMSLGLREKVAKGGGFVAASAVGAGATTLVNNAANRWGDKKRWQNKDGQVTPWSVTKNLFGGALSGVAGGVSGAVRGGYDARGAKHYRDVKRSASYGARRAIDARDRRDAYADSHPNDAQRLGNIPLSHMEDALRGVVRWAGFDSLDSLEKEEKTLSSIKSAKKKLADAAKSQIEGDVAKHKNLTYSITAHYTQSDAQAIARKADGYFKDTATAADKALGKATIERYGGRGFSTGILEEIQTKMSQASTTGGTVDHLDAAQWKLLYDDYLKKFGDQLQNRALLSEGHFGGIEFEEADPTDPTRTVRVKLENADRVAIGDVRNAATEYRTVLGDNIGNSVISEANREAGTTAQKLDVATVTSGDLVVTDNSALSKLGDAIDLARQRIEQEKSKIRKKQEDARNGSGGGKK